MRGLEKRVTSTGCPWPGGDEVEFGQADVVQLGKLRCWGSACVQFIVRLRDGREVFVRAGQAIMAKIMENKDAAEALKVTDSPRFAAASASVPTLGKGKQAAE